MAPALASITSNFTFPNRRVNRKAPASPLTKRTDGADQNGHLGKVKARRGGRRAEERMGAGIYCYLTAEDEKIAQSQVSPRV